MINKLAWKEIDLSSLFHNLSILKNKVGKNVEIIPVVKADAYGHGARLISRFLSKNGIRIFAVAIVEEGIELRNYGIREKILVLSPQFVESISYLVNYNLTPVVSSLDFLHALGEYTFSKNIEFSFHLGIDTGMGREGIIIKDLDKILKIIEKYPNLKLEGLSSHLSSSEDKLDPYNEKQGEIFEKAYNKLRNLGYNIFCHFANTGAIFNFPEFFYHGVRPGIALYGYGDKDLIPVMSVKAKITLIKLVPENWGIGYNHTYMTKSPTLIGLVPLGYADGYRRDFSNKAYVIVKDKLFPVIGRISMDQFVIDISSDPSIKVGDIVIVLGRSGNLNIDAEKLSSLANTIPYEILTTFGMAKRLGTIYKFEGKVIEEI
ncbi:MAG: alanine racemase [Dictyoglomus sp.]|nr:alanine racemase [Dictyoglomus sp.]MCX7942006.1 alanine racemase [Dictyoglomaceae bacterium]MDW8188732.1 alanine racemase [Dictyoglomus sp.]